MDSSARPRDRWSIGPRREGALTVARDVARHRRFISFLGARALRKIYRRTALGWSWLFIRPLFPIVLRTVIFGGLIGVSSDGIPYFLFLMVGSLPWDLFAASLIWGTRGLEMHGGLLDHVYVPRIILPVANMAPAFLELAIKLAVLGVTLLYFRVEDGQWYLSGGPSLALAPLIVLLAWGLAVAISLFTSIWGEVGRDARFTMTQVLSVWFLATPILYPMSAVPEAWQGVVQWNPMATIVEVFKWSVLGIGVLSWPALLRSTITVLTVLTTGLLFFGRRQMSAEEAA